LKRYLYIAENHFSYKPSDREYLLKILRSCFRAANIRIAIKHIEIEIWDPDIPVVILTIKSLIGDIILWRSLEEEPTSILEEDRLDILKKFIDLFNSERFWEAHGVLETAWRSSGERVLQGLILVAASFVKIQEGRIREFEILANKALKLLDGVSRYICIDINRIREDLRKAMETLTPFKITCEE
jgi:hypothetical protein